jgi:hypothetical protein
MTIVQLNCQLIQQEKAALMTAELKLKRPIVEEKGNFYKIIKLFNYRELRRYKIKYNRY